MANTLAYYDTAAITGVKSDPTTILTLTLLIITLLVMTIIKICKMGDITYNGLYL